MTGAPDPLSLLGKTLAGHFLVEALAGEGIYSIVYRGQHIGPKKPVALKCLKLGTNLDNAQAETFLRRFREDNKVNSQLTKQNPQFVRSIGSGMTTSGSGVHVPYTVFEWLEGRSLAADFAARRSAGATGRPLRDIVALLEPAALAIAFAHDEKIAHGDVNAGNFFLVPRGGDAPAAYDVKVLDFGIAKVVGDLVRDLVPEAKQERIFSPAYGAPEHFDRAVGEFGPWTDCYGLALILVEAMRDRPAVSGDLARAALDPAKRPTPGALGIPVGDRVEAVFVRALAKQPRDRWQHARDLWKALKDAIEGDEASLTVRTAPSAPMHDDAFKSDARQPVDGKPAASADRGSASRVAAAQSAPGSAPSAHALHAAAPPAPPPSAPSVAVSPGAGAPVAVTALPVPQPAGMSPSATPFAGGPLRSPVAGTAMKSLVQPAPKPSPAAVTPTAVRTQKLPTPAPSPSPIVGQPAPAAPASKPGPAAAPAQRFGASASASPNASAAAASAGAAPRPMPSPPGRGVPLAGGPGSGATTTPGLAPYGGPPIPPPPPSSPTEVGRPMPPPRAMPFDRDSPAPLFAAARAPDAPPPAPASAPHGPPQAHASHPSQASHGSHASHGSPPMHAPVPPPPPAPAPAPPMAMYPGLAHGAHAPPGAAPPPPSSGGLAPPGVGVATIPNAPPPAAARAEPLVGVPDMARTVREMLPPPKANIAVGDLPSVIVNDPESQKERIARSRETVRLQLPTPKAWQAAPTVRSGLSYEQRKARNRRRLLIVALVSFLVVFAAGAGLLGLHYLSTQGQLTWPPR